MAGIITDFKSDIQRLNDLKKAIADVKNELRSINIKVDIDIAKGLEAQLKSLTNQYHGIVDKIAQAEAKILLSVKKINDASEKIIQAQEKVSKFTNTPTQTGNANTQANSAEIANIQAQAKAYEDLRTEINDILGTRDANVKRMVEEMNAIRLINVEIKKIAKSRGESSSLSSAQQKRLEQLNNSLLTHKTALSEVRQTLSNNVKLDNAAATSMNGLSQSLSRMRIAYRELTEEERNSPIGKELLASINQADAKIKELDATIGNHQRNVGNYGKQWNGLSMSIQQVGRELPSLAYGPKVFFSAISNNLPILADEIKRARTEYELLKKSGQSATPVWKQVVSSLFSWQTALTIGITLLTLYGDKIVDWIGGLLKAKNAVKELLSAEQEIALARKKAASDSIKERTELDLLYKKLKDTTISTKERNAAINEWIKKYPQHTNILDGERINLAKLELAYKTLSNEIYRNAVARSYVDKIADLSVKKEKEEIKRLNQKLTVSNAEQDYKKQIDEFNKQQEKGFGTATAKIEARDKVEKARKNVEDQKKTYNALVENVKTYEDNINTISNHIKTLDLFPQPEKGTYDYWTQQVQIADTALKQIKDSYLKVLQSGDKEKIKLIPDDVVKRYDTFTKQKAEAEKALKVYDTSSKQESQAEALRKEREKYDLLMDKQALDRKRQTEDLENQLAQTKIDAMASGFDKEKEQRDLNNKKEIQALERQKEDYIRTIIQAEKEKFDAEEELKAKQTKGYKKRTFDSSTITVDTSKYDKIIENTQTKQAVDEWEKREQAMNEYLLKYGTFSQKKEAIDKKYRAAMEKETTFGGKGIIQKEWDEALANLDLSKLKEDINWGMVFGDLSKVTKDQLTKIKKQLQEFKKSPEFKNATPEQIQVIENAINSINNALVDKGGFFGGLADSLTEYESTVYKVKEAQEELEKALKSGDEAAIEKAKKKKSAAEQNQANAQTNVEKSKDKAISNITAVANAMTQLGSAEFSLSSFGSAVGGLVDALSESGSKIGGIIAAILSLLDEFGKDGGVEFGKNIVNNVISAIGGTIEVPFKMLGIDLGLGGANYTEYDEMVAKYDTLLDVWDQLLDKKKAYIKESYGIEATKAGQEALDLLNSERKITRELASSRLDAGASAGSHSMNYRMWKGSYDYEGTKWKDVAGQISNVLGGVDFSSMWSMLDMSSEQLEWIKINYSGLWASMDSDFMGYLDDIIQYGDTEKEIIKSINEQLTQTSFDSVFDSFVNTLMDMDASSKDFADSFEEYMRKAIFTSMFAKNYEDELTKWYEAFAEANKKKEGITEDDVRNLKNRWDGIVNSALSDRETWEKIVGSSDSESSREASQKGIATASQDSVDENNGRLAVMQEHTYSINENVNRMATGIDTIVSHTVNLSCLASIDKTMQSLLTMRNEAVGHLSNIDNYTSNLVEMKQYMNSMKQDINTMLIKGLKLSK